MKYQFEIRNEQGEVTKRGVMQEGEKIPFDILDYSYTISMNDYPYQLVREGLVPKGKNDLNQSLPVKYMHELNGKAYVMFKGKTEAIYNGKTIAGENVTQLDTVKGVNRIQLRDRRFLEFRSEKESADEKILSAAYTESQLEIANGMVSLNMKANAYEKALDFIKIKEPELKDSELYDAYLILKRIELKENMRNLWNSNTNWNVSNDIHNKINAAGEIDSVNAYRIANGIRTFIGSYDLSSNRTIHAKEYDCIILDGYKNKQYVSSRMFLEVSGLIKSLVWKKDREAEDMYQRAIERGKLTGTQNEDIDEFLRVYNSFNSINRIVDAPKVITSSATAIDLEVANYELIKNLGVKCYLSFSKIKNFSSDMLLNKLAIDSRYVTIDKFLKGVDDTEDMILWIETAQGIVISDAVALFADDHDLYRSTILESHFANKNENVLLSAVKEVDPVGYQEIFRDMIQNAYDEQATGRLEVYTSILYQMIRNHMYDNSWPVFKAVLALRNTAIVNATKFFSKEIVFNQRLSRIELPHERDCVAIIETFHPQANTIRTSYSTDRELEVTHDLTIIRFLDWQTFNYSGHITLFRNRVIGNENFDIRVVV